MPDMLWIHAVECRVRLGVPAAERARRQKILVDVGLEVDAGKAAERDDFRLAADYCAVEKLVRRQAEAGERALIETLAERLADGVLLSQSSARAVTVRVRKAPAVMPKTGGVSIEIRREARRSRGAR